MVLSSPAVRLAVLVIGGVVLLPVVYRYFVIPILLWRRQPTGGLSRYATVDDMAEMPRPASAYLAHQALILGRLGFTPSTPFHEWNDGGYMMYHQVHVHRQTGDVATIGLLMRTGSPEIVNVTRTFRSMFASPGDVWTAHSPMAASAPDTPGTSVFRVGRVVQFGPDDLERLYQMHRVFVRRTRTTPQRRALMTDPIEYQRELEQTGRRDMVASGWFWENATNQLQKTLKGAFLSVWRELIPWCWKHRFAEHDLATSLLEQVIRELARDRAITSGNQPRRTPRPNIVARPDLA
jgi:hypothetical protein